MTLSCPLFDPVCLVFGRDRMAQFRADLTSPEKLRVHSPLGDRADLARHLILPVLAVPA